MLNSSMLVTLLNYILLDLKIPAWITLYNLNIMFKGTFNSRHACAIYFFIKWAKTIKKNVILNQKYLWYLIFSLKTIIRIVAVNVYCCFKKLQFYHLKLRSYFKLYIQRQWCILFRNTGNYLII